MVFTPSVAKSAHFPDKRIRGLCDPDRRTIWISSRQSRVEQERTFVHELLHATAGEPRNGLENDAEEWTIGRIEDALHRVLASGEIAAEEG